MHPAISVIFFTVTSGAGFGLIAMIGVGAPMSQGPLAAFLISLLAGGLAVAGLISSTFHLGHPERAWRAFSQWRSSWLSREGVLAVATLFLFGVYVLFWLFAGNRPLWLGVLIAFLAIVTVVATAMIYTQLRTVPHWNSILTPLVYVGFAIACGYVAAAALNPETNSSDRATIAGMACLVLIVAWALKMSWWHRAGRTSLAAVGSTPETATGLGAIGRVRLLESPHSGENYLTREMVHVIGRKHAAKLRAIALTTGFAAPLLISLAVAISGGPLAWLGVAFVCLIAGLFVERWLFFAEARHAVSLYYGR
ncbi:dimethyl sulfoxide reductase anchor subunit [Hoeflea sp. WL0058]|uniref:Dimethyl sulfoxide reductase anchor subunit n=1 Tax=Flavimaribacter sediminis TaxID=2865987 RepID=A0AAE2ZQ74_9HYPH|nr:DmsC/YnfH family molybdoenzyme membrane anchor subunit [Flavimaribacter sediminis]MBW8640004.1 dimethyl sulfoxide reductase anchor subunit [Flavimaribacter sediminis]